METEASLWDPDLDELSTLIPDESLENLRELAPEGCLLCVLDSEDDD